MTDLTTPSSATMGTIDAGATPQPAGRPEKPDDAAYKTKLEEYRKQLEGAKQKTKQAQERVNSTQTTSKDSPTSQRQKELRDRLGEIRKQQQSSKSSRQGVLDRVKTLDTQLKAKITEHKNSKARMPFKSTQELDAEVARMEKQVDSGTMKLVDEKKTLSDITNLRKTRKQFAELDKTQADIDTLKAEIAELKKGMEGGDNKTLSDEYTSIQTELDQLKADSDAQYKGLNASRDEVRASRTRQNEIYQEMKSFQDEYFQNRRRYQEYEREANKQRDAKRKAERDAYHQEKRKQALAEKIEDARFPAYREEVRAAESILRLLDPNSLPESSASGPGQYAASVQRTVDDANIKGMKLSKKDEDEESYFVGGGGKKKGKKGRRGGAGEKAPNVDLGSLLRPGLAEQFQLVGMDAPATQDEVPPFIEKLKAQRQTWLDDSERKTQENIENARREFEKMEAASGGDASADVVTTKADASATADDTESSKDTPLSEKTNGAS